MRENIVQDIYLMMLRGSGVVRSRLALKPVTGSAVWASCALRSNGTPLESTDHGVR